MPEQLEQFLLQLPYFWHYQIINDMLVFFNFDIRFQMLSDKSTVCPNNLLDIAHQKKGVKVAIVNAGKTLPMISAMDAVKEKLIVPVLIGDETEIKKSAEDIKIYLNMR